MKRYRITKYNPEYRDCCDRFIINEWTSMSDIGKRFDGNELTVEEYLQTENHYIDAIMLILNEYCIKSLKVNGIEKHLEHNELGNLSECEMVLYKKISNNSCLELKSIAMLVKLVLRELMWCTLCSDGNEIIIEFGYDYYMYVTCSNLSMSTISTIQDNGLFVELL